MPRFSIAAIALITLSCSSGDGSSAHPGRIEVVDDNGRPVVLVHAARRVVSLVPAATQIIAELGLPQTLIAHTTDDSALEHGELANVGSVLDPSIERIVAMQPDLVIAWAEADALLQRLDKAGIPTYAARFDRIDNIAGHTRRIGVLLGIPARADSIAQSIAAELAFLQTRFATAETPTVLYLLEVDPIWTAGTRTFIDDMIQAAGGRNIFADLAAPWSQVSLEAVVKRQPDVIIVSQHHQRTPPVNWLRQPGWRELRAVRNQRVHFVDAEQFNLPGTNTIRNVHQLALLLHPERSK